MLSICLALALPLFLFAAAFIVGCFEELPVRMFRDAGPGPVDRYTELAKRIATVNGFVHLADGTHSKYSRLRAVLLLSQDRLTLAIIAAGTIIGLPSKKTILISQTTSGRVLISTDEAGTAELDPDTTRLIVMNASFPDLFRRHCKKIEEIGTFRSFPADAGWPAVDAVYRQRCDRMAMAGMVRYVDPERNTYCKTIYGSLRGSILHGIGQILYPPNWWRHLRFRPG